MCLFVIPFFRPTTVVWKEKIPRLRGRKSIGMMKRACSTGRACSLDDISEDTTQLFTLSSPRSAEALARHGMLLEDLQYRPLEEYKERGVPHQVALLRYEHNEAGRRERIKQVKHEYRVICGTPGTRTWNGLPFQVKKTSPFFFISTCCLSPQRRLS